MFMTNTFILIMRDW